MLNKITTAFVREWRANAHRWRSLADDGRAYRLLRAILMTAAVEDRLIARNPCQIRGADKEQSEERPVVPGVDSSVRRRPSRGPVRGR